MGVTDDPIPIDEKIFDSDDFRSGCRKYTKIMDDMQHPLTEDRRKFFSQAFGLFDIPKENINAFVLNFMQIHAGEDDWATNMHRDAMTIQRFLFQPRGLTSPSAQKNFQDRYKKNAKPLKKRRGPENFCRSRMEPSFGPCTWSRNGKACRLDHTCPSCGEDHPAAECKKFDEEKAKKADKDRRELNGQGRKKRN